MKGRPYGQGLMESFKLRVSPALAARIRRSADRHGVTVSAWFRQRALDFLDGQQDAPEVHTEPRRNGLTQPEDFATNEVAVYMEQPPSFERTDPTEALRAATAGITGKPAPNEPQDDEPGERFFLVHLIQEDGSCAGGCDPDTDQTCLVGPTDPRRTGKRRR